MSEAEWGYPLKYKISVPRHAHEPTIGLDPQFGERTVNELEAQASGTNFWSFRTLVDLQTQQVVAAIGDLAGNVGFVTNTILLNLTTNAAYAYDMAGNVTNISYNAGEETVGLIWNSQYELTAVYTNGALAESYRYDPLGRRVRTITGTVTNYHLYNGIHALADLDATGAVLRAYTYGPGIDNLLAMTTFSSTETNHYFYLTDHLGSVLAITDAEGEIVERYDYDAWGRVTIADAVGLPLAGSALGNRFGFQGREHSWATGLIHFRARWYDPITGRWLSKDPIGISGGLNQYVAFEGNPMAYLDPLGLESVIIYHGADKGGIGRHTGKDFRRFASSSQYDHRLDVNGLSDANEKLRALRERGVIITELYLLDHGSPANQELGDDPLLPYGIPPKFEFPRPLAELGAHLEPDGHIILMGCNVAKGDEGKNYVQAFANDAGRRVSANDGMLFSWYWTRPRHLGDWHTRSPKR